MRMHGMRIADYTEHYQPKERVIRKRFHSWEELAWELIRGSQKSRVSRAHVFCEKNTCLTYSGFPNKLFSE